MASDNYPDDLPITWPFRAAGTLLISAGPRLAAAPTWVWIAVGGVGLLGIAAMIERSDRAILPILRDDSDDGDEPSLLESFCQDFE